MRVRGVQVPRTYLLVRQMDFEFGYSILIVIEIHCQLRETGELLLNTMN